MVEIIDLIEYKKKKNVIKERVKLFLNENENNFPFSTREDYQNYLKENLSEEDFLEFEDARDNPRYYLSVDEDIMDFVDTYFQIAA